MESRQKGNLNGLKLNYMCPVVRFSEEVKKDTEKRRERINCSEEIIVSNKIKGERISKKQKRLFKKYANCRRELPQNLWERIVTLIIDASTFCVIRVLQMFDELYCGGYSGMKILSRNFQWNARD